MYIYKSCPGTPKGGELRLIEVSSMGISLDCRGSAGFSGSPNPAVHERLVPSLGGTQNEDR